MTEMQLAVLDSCLIVARVIGQLRNSVRLVSTFLRKVTFLSN